MARLVVKGIPLPPAGQLWCAACLALAKGSAMAAMADQVQAALADGDREHAVIHLDSGLLLRRLELAVGDGPSLVLGGAVVPLCGTHFPAVDGNAPPPRQPAPGLYRGGPG